MGVGDGLSVGSAGIEVAVGDEAVEVAAIGLAGTVLSLALCSLEQAANSKGITKTNNQYWLIRDKLLTLRF